LKEILKEKKNELPFLQSKGAMFLSNSGTIVFAKVPGVQFFSLLGTSKTLNVGGVGGRKTPVFTANISTFHMVYREYVFISNEFYEFC
jgi:hypothetical protein